MARLFQCPPTPTSLGNRVTSDQVRSCNCTSQHQKYDAVEKQLSNSSPPVPSSMIPAIRHPDFPFTRTSISVNRTLLPLQLILRPRISLRWHDAVCGTVLDLGACQNRNLKHTLFGVPTRESRYYYRYYAPKRYSTSTYRHVTLIQKATTKRPLYIYGSTNNLSALGRSFRMSLSSTPDW